MKVINKTLIFSKQITPESGVLAQFYGIIIDDKNKYIPTLYCIDYDNQPSMEEINAKMTSLEVKYQKYEVIILFMTTSRYKTLFERSLLMTNAYYEYEKLIDDKIKEMTKK